jgi:alkyl sulfatase BDS1-like metallo-beta-lactamase superfamily hydrolase
VLHAVAGHAADADATVTLDRSVLIDISAAEVTAAEAVASGRATVDGDVEAFTVLFDHLDVFMSMFPIVEP